MQITIGELSERLCCRLAAEIYYHRVRGGDRELYTVRRLRNMVHVVRCMLRPATDAVSS